MPPPLPHIVYGKVLDIYGNNLSGATVTLTHESIDPILISTSDSVGDYRFNLGDLDSSWSVGQNITLKATKIAEGTKSITIAITGGGGQEQNITLAETSDFVYDTQVQNRTNIVMSVPLHYDGLKVTRERGLPVYMVLERQYTQVFSALDSDPNKVEYQGWGNPGSLKSEAKWRIMKIIYSGNFITGLTWASGNQNFDKIWDNRTTYIYS